MTLENGLTELLSLSNVHIVNIKEPDPGNWRLRVSSTGPHTVRVTGLSTADFATGFSKQPTKDFSQTSLRPIQGNFLNVFHFQTLILACLMKISCQSDTVDLSVHQVLDSYKS